ncbi:DUF2894 domain-containing protein [Acidovorax sp. RAC01]|uniref:DUF2894 domain-containing protein n=1 Tax=Acidovorax sp. RAC01 TaxID=1842533 RepID=UPI00085552A3|nr:DUF2894 domain-containing protein [Acidovorax sp. RAC01]AOG22478.1 hypothetical protein BSY15_4085 [Acidovorax sp. RAC01]
MNADMVPEPQAQPALDALEALRVQGLEQSEPVRFRYLQALAGRMDGQPDAVRQLLAQRLDTAVAAYRAKARAGAEGGASGGLLNAGGAGVAPDSAASTRAMAALAQLNRDLGAPRLAAGNPLGGTAQAQADALAPRDLRSVRQFSTTLARISAEQKVAKAVARGPQNAGPLNAHRLVVQALAAMQAVSPDYVQRFLVHAETLLWMEQAHQQARRVRPPARGRSVQAGR